jgi:hypothetical protein
MRWKLLGAVLLVVVGIGAAALAVVGPGLGGAAATQYLTSQATVTDVVDTVAAPARSRRVRRTSSPSAALHPSRRAAPRLRREHGQNRWPASRIIETVTVIPRQAVVANDVSRPRICGRWIAVAQAESLAAKAPRERQGRPHRNREAAALLQVTRRASSRCAQASSPSSVARTAKLAQAKDASPTRARA